MRSIRMEGVVKLRSSVLAALAAVGLSAQAAPVQWSGNGHWYLFVETGLTAPQAFAAAAATTWMGMPGYLATITSAAENDFVASLAFTQAGMQQAWLGGSDDGAPVNQWTWRVGPEAGQAFTYTNWGSGEPNNCCGGENYLAINWGGRGLWNDYGPPAFAGASLGYVIEYSPVSVPNPTPAPATAWLALGALAALGATRRRG